MENRKQYLEEGQGYLGIELGSTRIKAVIIDDSFDVIASGSHTWENRLQNGVWTYTMEDISGGIRAAYADLKKDARERYGAALSSFRAIGISAMMHGYLPFDREGRLLSMFRTWRNISAHEAAERMTKLLQHNIPDRWSLAHLYDAILRNEEHVRSISFMTTLAGYIHFRLTGKKVIGVGDASGIFPVDTRTGDYREDLLAVFDREIEGKGYPWKTKELLPKVLRAGEDAGTLTKEGALFLDPEGLLTCGIPLCPPEGDAATGMIATNSIRKRSGNLSAGTSGFLMAVLENEIHSAKREIEQINTPDGSPVAMVHANNCTTDISAWVSLFGEFASLAGAKLSTDDLYGLLYRKALEGEKDAGGILSYNYHAGEFIAGLEQGCPLVVRTPDAAFDLANFMRAQLYGTVAVLRLGVDLLTKEGVSLDAITAHGGLFKTPGVAQKLLAGALHIPVRVMETAGEGGAWGIAILAANLVRQDRSQSLPDYPDSKVFAHANYTVSEPDADDARGYDQYMEAYRSALDAERAAVRA
ncbi:MAG: ATPase, partial [Lachnospiraceae bacterium]|nr:ATPase [Lachnospiraceae bacterium]